MRIKLFTSLLAIICAVITYRAQAQTISTYAGNGIGSYSGDGGAATAAAIHNPYGVCVDGSGNIFIADQSNNRVRKVNSSGIISTIAGTGSAGYNGDGIAGTAAMLNGPTGVAVDGAGNVYIADENNHRIRKINTSGTISTIAGTGAGGYSGDGGAATAAAIHNPWAVALDGSGNVFFSDQFNHRIRKINSSGVINTYVGTGTSGFSGDGGAATAATIFTPADLVVDGSGNLFFGDVTNQRIRKVNASGMISTVAGNGTFGFTGDGGAATAAELYSPYGICVDGSGNLYIADLNNDRIPLALRCCKGKFLESIVSIELQRFL